LFLLPGPGEAWAKGQFPVASVAPNVRPCGTQALRGEAMSDEHDDAVLQTLLDRLLQFRLPRALALKKRVDAGECLTDSDIEFLKVALEDAQSGRKYVARNPEFHRIGTQIVQLYGEIVSRAVENEKERGRS